MYATVSAPASLPPSLPPCLPATISICIYVRRQLNAALAAATSLLSLPLSLSPSLSLHPTLLDSLCEHANRCENILHFTESNRVLPCPMSPAQSPDPLITSCSHSACCKRCSICNVNWTTAVAAMLTAQCVPPSEIVHFSWKLNRKLQRILVNWKRYA